MHMHTAIALLIALFVLWAVWSSVGLWVVINFIRTWGWGDASWGDKKIHPGTPDDEWHQRRRQWFYLVAFWAVCLNPVALYLFARKRGRVWFRQGVKEASEALYYEWYPEEGKH